VKVAQAAKKYAAKGNYLKALKEYQRIVDDDPTDIRVWLKIGDLYSKCSEPEKAVSTYVKIAEYYTEQGFFLKAVAVYKQAIKLDQIDISPNLKLAELYRRLGLFSEAMQQYEIISIHYHNNGNTSEALASIRKLVELDPENIASRIKLAELYSQQNLTTEAVEEFNKVADYLRETGETEDFLKVGERLMYLVPDNLTIARELAGLYLRNGQPQNALRNLQQAFATNTKDVETLELLAQSFVDLSREDKAISVLKELAKILGEENQADRRLQIFRRILELSPEDNDALSALGVDTGTAKSDSGSATENEFVPIGENDIEMLEELDVGDVQFIEDDEQKRDANQFSEISPDAGQDIEVAFDTAIARIAKPTAQGHGLGITPTNTSSDSEDSLLIEISMDDDPENPSVIKDLDSEVSEHALSKPAQDKISESLEEAEFFIQQNLIEEAKAILRDLSARFPNTPAIEEKLKAIDLNSNASTLKASHGKVLAPLSIATDTRSNAIPHENDIGAITIAAEIQAEVDQYETDSPSVTDFAAVLDLNIEDVIGELKKGVLTSEVSDDDANTHYDLGTAYREMEMYDAAIAEFSKSEQSKDLSVMSLVMIASCHSAQEQYEAAKKVLQKAQIHPMATDREHIAIQFDLAQIHAKCGEVDTARQLFEDIRKRDPSFSNVRLQLDMLNEQHSSV